MALITAICTTLTSAGVLASLLTDRKHRRQLQLLLGIAVFSIAGVMSAELFTYQNPSSVPLQAGWFRLFFYHGHINPSTTAVFLLLGYTLVLCGQKEERLRTGLYIRVLSLLLFLYGGGGVVESFLKFASLHSWYSPAGLVRLSLPMSVGTMLFACGFWLISLQKEAQAEVPKTNGQELAGIVGISTIVVFSVAAASGLTVIALVQRSMLHATLDHLAQVACDDRALIEQAIHDRSEVASLAASGARLPEQIRAWSLESAERKRRNSSSADANSPSPLEELATSLLKQGFSGISFQGTNGEQLRIGNIIDDSALRAPVRDGLPGELIWKDGYFLSTRATVRDQDGVAGEMLAQQPLLVLDRLTTEREDGNPTVTLLLCTRANNTRSANCFPTRLASAPFRIALGGGSGHTKTPIELALAGESGTGLMKNYRNASVDASYLPVRNASLGLVLGMDSAEIDEQIQANIERALPLIVLFSLSGLWVMQWRLRLLVDKLLASREQIRQLALHDVLTGLPNRSLMEDRLQMAIHAARRNGSLVALAIVDVDNFKTVNDNFGHETGDLVLKAVANGLRSSIRASDTAARLGGDEFVLIIPEIKFPEATILVAKKIQAIFSSPITAGTYTSSISLSIGVAVYPAAGEDSQSLLRNADAAMYRAKKQGGNRFEIYGPTLRGSS